MAKQQAMTAKAKTLEEVVQLAGPEPLTTKTWSLYVDTEEARGGRIVPRIIRQLSSVHDRPQHALFAGHTGCGKSTELVRVGTELSRYYDVLYCQVQDRYSLTTLDYRQLLFLCAQLLIEHAQKSGVHLEDDVVTSLLDWFDAQTVEEVKKKGYRVGLSGELGGKAEVGTPSLLGKMGLVLQAFLKMSGEIFSGGETQIKVLKHIEQRLDLLVRHMAVIVRIIENAIQPKRLLLILEGLDKVEDLEQARKLFIDHRPQLLSIPASVIFTCPIRLWYDAEGLQAYPVHYLLPMIPVTAPPKSLSLTDAAAQMKMTRGLQTLRLIIEARVDTRFNLIEPEALNYIIIKSGGVLRDLFTLLRESALEALLTGKTSIAESHARSAAHLLRNDYVNRLSPPARGGSAISFDDIKKALGTADEWPRRDADKTPAFKLLLQTLCILEYNGETWHNLHPLVHEYLLAKEAAEEERRHRREPELSRA